MSRTIIATLIILGAGGVLVLFSIPTAGQDEPQPDPGAEALKKAVETGKALFENRQFGNNGRSCSLCHDDSVRRPRLYLKKVLGEFPRWDRREKKVITLGQKLNQMLQKNLQGEALELGSEKLVALEAYLKSLSKQAD